MRNIIYNSTYDKCMWGLVCIFFTLFLIAILARNRYLDLSG